MPKAVPEIFGLETAGPRAELQATAVDAVVMPFIQPAARLTRAERDEARNFALLVLRDPTYRRNFLTRARIGKLAPAVEVALWHYGWSKPIERHEHGSAGEFESLQELSIEELQARAALLHRSLGEAREAQGIADTLREVDDSLKEQLG
jgi:hypothetical protein